jgi:hypothetical protein
MQAEASRGNPNQERAPGAYTNEIGAAAISTDEIDPLDIFGEPMHATEGAQEVYGWPFPAPAYSLMRRAVIACAGFALVGVLLAVAASRRYLPTPRRLATILVVAGAQTGHALAPPTQTAPPNSARHLGPCVVGGPSSFPVGVGCGGAIGQRLDQPGGLV